MIIMINCDTSITMYGGILGIGEYNYIHIFKYLNSTDKLNFISTSQEILKIVKNSNYLLKNIDVTINHSTFNNFNNFNDLRFKNIILDLNNDQKYINNIISCYDNFKKSVEKLTIKNFKSSNIFFQRLISNSLNLKSLTLDKCNINLVYKCEIDQFIKLKHLSFIKCNDIAFSLFYNQCTIETIYVENNDWTWNGFSHENFNRICENNKNLNKLVLKGDGTGSYFDSDEFPYKIKILDTTMITFHWYVGIRNPRINFLQSQIESLKDLTIHTWPNDFDGGRVLKYIFNEMRPERFCFKNIELISNSIKQPITTVDVMEINITSLFELIEQFPTITIINFKIMLIDVDSNTIESEIIRAGPRLFNNILELNVFDNSRYGGKFCIFLNLFKKMINIKKLKITSKNKNIDMYLEELYLYMTTLEDISIERK